MTPIDRLVQTMDSLYNRWQDEKEYEDWADYIKYVKGVCQDWEAQYVSLKKRPFSLIFIIDNNKQEIRVTKKRITLREI